MIERLLRFMDRIREWILQRWYLCALFYALIVLAVYVTWLFLDGNSVSFVYSEF